MAEVLVQQADVAYPAADLGGGRVAFHVHDAGLSRAAEVCRQTLEQLRLQAGAGVGSSRAPAWRCRSADATCFDSVEECVRSLVGERAEPSGPAVTNAAAL